jgi:hypothetical protein
LISVRVDSTLDRVKSGAGHSLRQALDTNDSREHRDLLRAISKAEGDREAAVRNVCRLYRVRTLDALPPGVMSAAVALIAKL